MVWRLQSVVRYLLKTYKMLPLFCGLLKTSKTLIIFYNFFSQNFNSLLIFLQFSFQFFVLIASYALHLFTGFLKFNESFCVNWIRNLLKMIKWWKCKHYETKRRDEILMCICDNAIQLGFVLTKKSETYFQSFFIFNFHCCHFLYFSIDIFQFQFD